MDNQKLEDLLSSSTGNDHSSNNDGQKHVFPCIENPFRVTLKCNGYYVYCVNEKSGKLATRKTRGHERDEFEIINENENIRLMNYKYGSLLTMVIDEDWDGGNHVKERRRVLQCLTVQQQQKHHKAQKTKREKAIRWKEKQRLREERRQKALEEKKAAAAAAANSSAAVADDSDSASDSKNSDAASDSTPPFPTPSEETTTTNNPQGASLEEEDELNLILNGPDYLNQLLQVQDEIEEIENETTTNEEEEEDTEDEKKEQENQETPSSSKEKGPNEEEMEEYASKLTHSDWFWVRAPNGKVLIKNIHTADSLGIDDQGNLLLIDSSMEDPENPQSLWSIETVTGELLFMSNVALSKLTLPSSSRRSSSSGSSYTNHPHQLRCDLSGRLSVVDDCRGWEVFRFLESSSGHGYIRISSWMHHQYILACNFKGQIQMQKIDSETTKANEELDNQNNPATIKDDDTESWCTHWAVEKAPNGQGVVIRSKKHGRFLNVESSSSSTRSANIYTKLSTYHPFDEAPSEDFELNDNVGTSADIEKGADDVSDQSNTESLSSAVSARTKREKHNDINRIINTPATKNVKADYIQEHQAQGETIISQDYFLHRAMTKTPTTETAAAPPPPASTTATPTTSRRRWFRRGGGDQCSDQQQASTQLISVASEVESLAKLPEVDAEAPSNPKSPTKSVQEQKLLQPKDTIVWNLQPAHLQQYNFYSSLSAPTESEAGTTPKSSTGNESTKISESTDDDADSVDIDDTEEDSNNDTNTPSQEGDASNHQQLSIGPFPQVSSNLRRTDKFQLIRTAATDTVNATHDEFEESENESSTEIIVTRLFHHETHKFVACSSDGKIYLYDHKEIKSDSDDKDADDDGSCDGVRPHPTLDETEWIMEKASPSLGGGGGGNIFQSRAYPRYYLSHCAGASDATATTSRRTMSSTSTVFNDDETDEPEITDHEVIDSGNSDDATMPKEGDASLNASGDEIEMQEVAIEDENAADSTRSVGPVRSFFRRRRQQRQEQRNAAAAAATTKESVKENGDTTAATIADGKSELVTSESVGEREKWVLNPVMPRAINSGKIKTFAIGTSLVVGSSLCMPFAMAGAGALLGAAGAHIGVVGHVVMAGLSSFDALSSVGTVGATAYLVFRSQDNAMTDDHRTDEEKEAERAWSKRPFSNWRNW